MTLPAIPGSFRPGGAVVPQPVAGSGSSDPEAYHLQFLTAEERATANLMSFFESARLELEAFIRAGDLSVSDATFYRQLLDETNRVASTVNAQGAQWTSSVIPDAYSAGWRASSSVVVPTAALEALSRDALGLITQTSNGIRQAVRQTIAQGILQGLPGAEVRARIMATGLTNIPHWPSVEYRAGVIARTETMKAFNAGIDDVSTANGAAYFEWIASPDEATCPICLPRDGVIYSNPRVADPTNAYPAAQPMPKMPAHPRCRCTKRAVYRGPDGKVIRQGSNVVEQPKLPSDAMGGTDAPTLPPAAGDLQKAFGRLAKGPTAAELKAAFNIELPAGLAHESLLLSASESVLTPAGLKLRAQMEADRAFWRSAGRFSDDDLRLLTHGLIGPAGNKAFERFLDLRFGIAWPKPLGWLADLRLSTLRALERIREIAPRYVVDSRYLQTLGEAPPGAKRFGSNVIARAFPTGHVQGNMNLWSEFAGATGRKLRAGVDVDAAEEVIIHEFAHTIHFRYGLYDPAVNPSSEIRQSGVYPTVEAVEQAFHVEFGALRKASRLTAPSEAELAELESAVRVYKEKIATAPEDSFEKRWATNMAAMKEEALAKLRAQLAANAGEEYFPTPYARQSAAEDFAETAMLYFLNPAFLKKWSPGRFEFMRTKVFPA